MRRDSKGRIGIKFDMEMNVCGVSSWAKQSESEWVTKSLLVRVFKSISR